VKKEEDRAVIDTNLLVRFLTEDDPEKAKAVETLLGKAGKGEIKILIPSGVIAELVWVLKSFYEMEAAEISELVGAVLSTPGLDTQDKSILREALNAYSGDSGHPFRSIPATCSDPFRPPVPIHSGHPFRRIPATPPGEATLEVRDRSSANRLGGFSSLDAFFEDGSYPQPRSDVVQPTGSLGGCG